MIRTNKKPTSVACAIYTRKSSEEGLDREFTSLDAQRERCEDYIASQKEEGWVCVPDRFDDGGYSGGSMERPALKRLLSAIESGVVDIVVVYKVDRLSRSLADFTRMIEAFEKRKVSFVSVTQRFDTSQSMGRLTLNMLLSFAQFERELTSERTRDKIAASRRRGKWWGARPPLGYSIDRAECRLVVMPEEAEIVRRIFTTYLETKSLLRTAEILNKAGLRTKRWTLRDGREVGGIAWDKPHVRLVIANATVRGLVAHHDETFPGQHEAIVDPEIWQQANDLLASNARLGSEASQPIRQGILNGLLRCVACDAAMTHACAIRGPKVYRYYNCSAAAKRGRSTCPYPSLPADQVESFVVDRLRSACADDAMVDLVWTAFRDRSEDSLGTADSLMRSSRRERQRLERELATLTAAGDGSSDIVDRLADLDVRIRAADEAIATAIAAREDVTQMTADRAELAELLRQFDPVWTRLAAGERSSLLKLLINRIDCDAANDRIAVTFACDNPDDQQGPRTR